MPRKKKTAATSAPAKKAAPRGRGRGRKPAEKVSTAAPNGGGNGKRTTNKDRILKAWGAAAQMWPPELGDKVRLFVPKELRGKLAKVIAVRNEKARNSTRVAPQGKARVMLKVDGEPIQFAVAQADVFPSEFKLKDIQAL